MTDAATIQDYNARAPDALRSVVDVLHDAIVAALPAARAQVWHGHPVWFDGDNPVVGYDVRKDRVQLLFWNGRAFTDPDLRPVGKHRAAGRDYRTDDDVDMEWLRGWLERARTDVFDSVAFMRAERAAARAARA